MQLHVQPIMQLHMQLGCGLTFPGFAYLRFTNSVLYIEVRGQRIQVFVERGGHDVDHVDIGPV